MTTKPNRKSAPSHDVVVDNGARFTGRDGKERISYERVGLAWSDETGITAVKLPLLGITLYFRERTKAEAEAAAAEGGQE